MKGARLSVASAVLAGAVFLALQYAEPPGPPVPPVAPPPTSSAPPEIVELARWRALAAEHGVTVHPDGAASPLAGWRVREHLSAHHVLIVRVETDRLGESLVIAQLLIEPVKARYAEALVYFYRPGSHRLVKRVQWTPQSGYVETEY